jgi:tRNA(Ile)-lysidine synthase
MQGTWPRQALTEGLPWTFLKPFEAANHAAAVEGGSGVAISKGGLADGPAERFRRDLDALVPAGTRIGLAVSGGPDSVALLLLASEARPGEVEAATVDHQLRPESGAEAEQVARLCKDLGVPHSTLEAKWREKPETALQERARMVRYRLLSQWAGERRIKALMTAHHLEDQAETFIMRLARGAGVKGLAAMRPVSPAAGGGLALVRPLLRWQHFDLQAVCAAAGVDPVQDPSNEDDRFERVRVRKALARADLFDPAQIARSAAHLAAADSALHWATTLEWQRAVSESDDQVAYTPTDAPIEIRRRIIRRAILKFASEGTAAELRGRELDQIVAALRSGKQATLRGVLCVGGRDWRFSRAPARKGSPKPASAKMGPVEG